MKGAWACPAAEEGREMEEKLARPRMDDPAAGLRGNEREHAMGCRAWRNTTLWRCAAAARRRTEQAAIAMALLCCGSGDGEEQNTTSGRFNGTRMRVVLLTCGARCAASHGPVVSGTVVSPVGSVSVCAVMRSHVGLGCAVP